MKRKIMRMALVLALLVSLCAARADALDLNKTGAIALEMKDTDGAAIPDGVFRLYRVGEATIRDNNLRFDLTDDFAESGASLDDLSQSGLAAALAEYADARDLPCTERTADAQGRAAFENVACGLYLIMQKAPESDYGYERMTAFLVSMPMAGDHADWTYSVTARPKAERTIVPTPTPQPTAPPDEPHLPQTGLLLWPVLAMAAAGLALFVCGWIVFFSRKRHG